MIEHMHIHRCQETHYNKAPVFNCTNTASVVNLIFCLLLKEKKTKYHGLKRQICFSKISSQRKHFWRKLKTKKEVFLNDKISQVALFSNDNSTFLTFVIFYFYLLRTSINRKYVNLYTFRTPLFCQLFCLSFSEEMQKQIRAL